MSTDLDQRLADAIQQRDQLSSQAQRIEGRKQVAEEALEAVRKEIREKNLDPDSLDKTIETLTAAYAEAVEAFEAAVSEAQRQLSPYLENTTHGH